MIGQRLYRAREDRWIAGVAGGLARFLGVDPLPVRVAFAALSLWDGLGVLLYLVMALTIPEEPTGHAVTEPDLPQEHAGEPPGLQRQRTLGLILVLGGLYLALRHLDLVSLGGERLAAVVLILAGLLILLLRPGRL